MDVEVAHHVTPLRASYVLSQKGISTLADIVVIRCTFVIGWMNAIHNIRNQMKIKRSKLVLTARLNPFVRSAAAKCILKARKLNWERKMSRGTNRGARDRLGLLDFLFIGFVVGAIWLGILAWIFLPLKG